MNANQKTVQVTLYVMVSALIVTCAFVLGYATHATYTPLVDQEADFGVFWEAWRIVDNHFYGRTDDNQARIHGAIKGSIDALQDPYTLFVEPQQRDREQEELRGSFGGIGAWVERSEDGRIFLTPMEGRSAAKAGVLAGDELLAVDGTAITAEMPFDDVLAMVRGEAGKTVRLTLRREGVAEPFVLEVEREEIVTPSVSYELMADDIGYIRLAIFNERTNQELQDAVRDLRNQGATRYVVDLRDNGGGLLPAAIDVASQFLSDGVVLYERDNNGAERNYPVRGNGILRQEPVVFLVNNGTASASEIVAGAIQDYERGILIGSTTFGKASVQLIFDLSDGSSVHVTNAHWLTPNRQEIDGQGLTPDIMVERTDQDRQAGLDPQLERAITYLQEN